MMQSEQQSTASCRAGDVGHNSPMVCHAHSEVAEQQTSNNAQCSRCSSNCSRRRPQQQLQLVTPLLLALFCMLQLFTGAASLACYETVNGKTTIVKNDAWTYCALVPATMVGGELVNGSQFGLGPDNDMLGAYNSAFAMSVDEYRILTVCIYERYDFSRFLTIKPDLAVEFAFRCVCNYDLCNSEPTFSAYLSAIKSESFARR